MQTNENDRQLGHNQLPRLQINLDTVLANHNEAVNDSTRNPLILVVSECQSSRKCNSCEQNQVCTTPKSLQ